MSTEELIKENMPMIKHIAKNFYDAPFEDLLQAGTIGILKAYKNYKTNGNSKFSTYAYDYIFGEMYDFVNKNRKIKVSKEMLRLAKQIHVVKDSLSLKMGHTPSYEEIATFLNISPATIANVLECTGKMVSFDAHEDGVRDLYETIPNKEKVSSFDKLMLKDAILNLSSEEQKIIKYRYYKDYTQKETAKLMGMSQVMVSRYENKSLKRLRSYYEE